MKKKLFPFYHSRDTKSMKDLNCGPLKGNISRYQRGKCLRCDPKPDIIKASVTETKIGEKSEADLKNFRSLETGKAYLGAFALKESYLHLILQCNSKQVRHGSKR
ncbi:CLUMA_CG000954, isoform A [Clunio marinus]|uniref:CLUMA_CG000954, isoform A n=1 Tax=Clunio marinus TaxID=568069 RepID=A0A1J1HLN7_9DIPT|nr:CLUMA_CG000954, isoform A [Clunio marinus]